jgi:hypothetical protein
MTDKSYLYEQAVPCPTCGAPIDAARQVKGLGAPSPGDLTMCFRCAALLMFDEPPAVHAMTDVELGALEDDEYEALRFAQQQLQAYWRTRR